MSQDNALPVILVVAAALIDPDGRVLIAERPPGKAIASLIDIAGDFALIAVLGYGVPTINFRVDYLRPAANADLLAQARVRRAGRTIGVVDIDVTDPSGRLIALGRGCYGTQPG